MKKNRNEEDRVIGRMAEAAGVPKELVLGVPVLHITGREENKTGKLSGHTGVYRGTDPDPDKNRTDPADRQKAQC